MRKCNVPLYNFYSLGLFSLNLITKDFFLLTYTQILICHKWVYNILTIFLRKRYQCKCRLILMLYKDGTAIDSDKTYRMEIALIKYIYNCNCHTSTVLMLNDCIVKWWRLSLTANDQLNIPITWSSKIDLSIELSYPI